MTIRDVAARAGVSAATVSRVFSRPESVTVETRRRVLSAADELRYAPHPVARSLARGSTGNLGLVVPDIAVAFCAVVTKAVSHRARRDGYALFVADSDDPSAAAGGRRRAIGARHGQAGRRAAAAVADDARRRPARPRRHGSARRDQPGAGRGPGRPHAQRGRRGGGRRAPARPRAPPARVPRRPRQLLQPCPERGAFTRTCGRLGADGVVLGPFEPTFDAGVRAADLVLADGATGVLAYNDDVAAGVVGRLADRGVPVPARLQRRRVRRHRPRFDDQPAADDRPPARGGRRGRSRSACCWISCGRGHPGPARSSCRWS